MKTKIPSTTIYYTHLNVKTYQVLYKVKDHQVKASSFFLWYFSSHISSQKQLQNTCPFFVSQLESHIPAFPHSEEQLETNSLLNSTISWNIKEWIALLVVTFYFLPFN